MDKDFRTQVQELSNSAVEAGKRLVEAGNRQRFRVRDAKGETLVQVPLAVGLASALFLPAFTVTGVFVALVTGCTVELERTPVEPKVEAPTAVAS